MGLSRMSAFYQLIRFMRPRFIQAGVLLVLTLFTVLSVCQAAVNEVTLESVLQQAEELQLAEHESWYALLHYKRETVLRRFISQVDDERFFLHKTGRTDAHAELLANINAFFRGVEPSHAQCLFPARWWWLKQQLNLPDDFDVSCPKLEVYMSRVSFDKLFLVFPTMYLNNPGSTFGHTFLRFDAEEESILLSETLNYAAQVDKSENIISLVGKGLFGGYRGVFRMRHYYETVQEYSNIENRDIWEYQLVFSAVEIQQLLRHVWEVKDIDFDYYFFRENCAYRLLALLDVIRPGMQLTAEGNFPFYAIPVDTVRALDSAGLIGSHRFRASLATQINDYFNAEDNGYSNLVIEIVSDEITSEKGVISSQLQVLNSDVDKLEVLRQSYTILQFHGESTLPKAQNILQLISELPVSTQSSENSVHYSQKTSPEKGHDSLRVAAGYGEQNNQQYLDLKFRPAFHDLLDAPQGYIDGAAINVFDVHLKWFKGNRLRLESLRFFNATSLSPVSRWLKPISWMLDFRLDRTQMSKTQSARNFISRGGAGFSFRIQKFKPFVLLMGEWNLSSSYAKGYSLLLGLQAGLHVDFKANQLMLSVEIDDAVAGFDLDKKITRIQWQYNLQVNHAVRAVYRRTQYDFFNDEDWSLFYHYYF